MEKSVLKQTPGVSFICRCEIKNLLRYLCTDPTGARYGVQCTAAMGVDAGSLL